MRDINFKYRRRRRTKSEFNLQDVATWL